MYAVILEGTGAAKQQAFNADPVKIAGGQNDRTPDVRGISVSGTTSLANSGTLSILNVTSSQITTQEQTIVADAAGHIVTAYT